MVLIITEQQIPQYEKMMDILIPCLDFETDNDPLYACMLLATITELEVAK